MNEPNPPAAGPNPRRTRIPLLAAIVVVAVGGIVFLSLKQWDRGPGHEHSLLRTLVEQELASQPLPGMKPLTNFHIVPTGLGSHEMRTKWHRTPEGSDVFPVALFRALTDPKTDRPLIESFSRFGLIAAPDDDTGLPVGFSRLKAEGHNVVLTGMNCATCHSSQITYRGKRLHIDGAPNFIDIEAFFRETLAALESMLKTDSAHRRKFLIRFLYYNAIELQKMHVAGQIIEKPAAGEHHSHEKVGQVLTFLKERVGAANIIIGSFEEQTPAGPGRADSFGIIRNLLMTKALVGSRANFRPMTAPVSIPHLFEFGSFTNLHWDGNTTTGNDRNYAQAIALGAEFDPPTKKSSVRPRMLYTMESIGQQLTAPKWPEDTFGPLDTAKVARGSALFRSEGCATCHGAETWTRLDVIGTDPNRLLNYNEPVYVTGGHAESYATNLYKAAIAVKLRAYADHAVPPAEQRQMDAWHERVIPEWIETRDKGYFTRRLRGLWATAPYLHNGSVPTLWHLLQPAADRPRIFAVGHREFDPVRVGFVEKPETVVWELDTTITGNRNIGHEFGTRLPEADKWALIEYLKTL